MRQIIRTPSRHGFYSKGDSNMNLTELQIQLREIEERISTLQGEIEKMKPQPEEEKKKVYETITKIAFKYPLENRRFSQAVLGLSRVYISCLAYITLADEKNLDEKLLYLCRLAHSMKCFTSAEDILRMGMEVDKEYFEKSCSELKKVKDSFLTDVLIIANFTEEATDVTFSLVADIAKIMESDKDELRVMALVAKSVLLNNFDNLLKLPVPTKNRWMGRFGEYIPASWIKRQRTMCGRYCTSIEKCPNSAYTFGVLLNSNFISSSGSPNRSASGVVKTEPCKVKSRLQAGSIVRKSDVLIEYEEKEIVKDTSNSSSIYFPRRNVLGAMSEEGAKERAGTKKIVAPCDGVLFLIEDEERDVKNNELRKYVVAYVVSYFDDYTEFCKQYKK